MANVNGTQQVIDRAGKPVNVGDACTVVGFILSVSTPTSLNTTVTVQLAGSAQDIQVQGQDIGATTQTL
jgi:hypothetical protein